MSSGDERHPNRWLGYGAASPASRSYRDVACSSSASPPRRAVSPKARRAPAPASEVHRVNDNAPSPDAADDGGWQQPKRRNRRPRPRRSDGQGQPRRRRSPTPEEAASLCFRYLEPGHPVRDCTKKVRCRRCLQPGHTSRECTPKRRASDRALACSLRVATPCNTASPPQRPRHRPNPCSAAP